MTADLSYNRLLNIPYGSLATKLSARPVRVAPRLIRLRKQLYAICGNTTARTGYRMYSLIWTKGNVEATFYADHRIGPTGCLPLTPEELPGVELCPRTIRSWMFRDVSVAASSICYSNTMSGFGDKCLAVLSLNVHYLKRRSVPKELPYAIEIIMRRRGAPRR